MQRVLVAGTTGYLGGFVIQELKAEDGGLLRGMYLRACAWAEEEGDHG